MEKTYNHLKHEAEIYRLWENSNAFAPHQTLTKPPFTIIMPPPNASDPLHIGHARFVAIQDIIIRYKRMRGFACLWLPGADHAGIETQYVFEKKLAKKGKSRFDFDRETLYQMIFRYVKENKKTMESQLKLLGASCDWSRNKFTLDPKIVKIVYHIFKKLYDDNLIYRGERIVNYCPRCGTSFSQLEVNYVERDDALYFLDYGSVTIATTRPETIFADVAVAVNPKDQRFKDKIGKKALLPLVKRELPIIADSLVDPEFGTGALKVTPGHDPTDFEIGQKHGLTTITVIDSSGRMINTPQKYVGLKVEIAKKKVVADLKAANKIKKIEKIHHLVGTCYRDKTLIEPLVSKQWFLKSEPLAKPALTAIRQRKVKFVSEKFAKIAIHWLKNLKDWNISRQIVWGIRIPAWRCQKCFEWVVTDGITPKKCPFCSHTTLVRDPDTFDTWFSSGQWPFATLLSNSDSRFKIQDLAVRQAGSKLTDFNRFYPTSLMETAYDILPFWVIRMIMLALYATGNVPFKEVLIHGLVRDAQGEKISKSKGNVINPVEMTEKYGADALRMAIIWGSLVENDICLSEDNIRGQRNFANKIWNIARFVLKNTTGTKNISFGNKRLPTIKHADDRWIVSELNKTIKKTTKALDKYRLNEAAEEIYNFVWHKFADKYIENCKLRIMNSNADSKNAIQVLYYLLNTSLHLLHPFMPFVTEAIYQKGFAKNKNDLLINASWPKT